MLKVSYITRMAHVMMHYMTGLLVCSLLFMQSACSGEKPPGVSLGKSKAVTAPAPAPKPKAVTKDEKTQAFVYDAVGKRDPFKPYIQKLIKDGEEPDKPRAPIERYELEQYRITGLLYGTSKPRAIVEDPTGLAHVLTLGSRIGRNKGVVRHIGNESITVAEVALSTSGIPQTITRQLSLMTQKEESGVQR